MTPRQYTPGQARVRALAAPLLPAFLAVHRVRDDTAICEELRERLAADPIVTADPITATPLGAHPFSTQYLQWLRAVSTPVQNTPPAPVRWEQVVLHGSVAGGWGPASRKPAFTGGLRWHSTMQTVFNCVAQRPVPTHQMHLRYFVRSGILAGEAGNHRLLGHLLAGETRLPALTVVEEQCAPSLALNDALMTLEQWCADHDLGRFWLALDSVAVCEREAQNVLDGVHETTAEERHLILTFLRERQVRFVMGLSPRGPRSPIQLLLAHRDELRALRGHRVIQRGMVSLRRWLGRAEGASVFERWLDQRAR